MEETQRIELVNDIIKAYLDLGDATRLASIPFWLSVDLNVSQLKAIILLTHHGEMSISELARHLGMGKPAASILVQQLVEEDFVERSEDARDRRRTIVRTTARGASLLTVRREQIRSSWLRWLSQLDDADLASLQSGFTALIRVVLREKK